MAEMHALYRLLAPCQYEQWVAALYFQGVRRAQDILELHDQDLARIGMATVTMRRMQRSLWELLVYSWLNAVTCCTPSAEHEEYRVMCDASKNAEMAAIDKLNEVIAFPGNSIGEDTVGARGISTTQL